MPRSNMHDRRKSVDTSTLAPARVRAGSLTRIAALRLAQAVDRAFLEDRPLRPTLAACAAAIARTLWSVRVSICTVGLDGAPLIVTHPPEETANADGGLDAHPQLEQSVPIPGEVGAAGTLTAAGAFTEPDDVAPFLEEAARELGHCLRLARSRAEASARLRFEGSLSRSELIGVVCVDGNHCVSGWNCGSRRLLGWDAADVLGRELSAAVGCTAYSQLHGFLEHARLGGRTIPCLIPLRRWDGREVPTRVEVLPPLDSADDVGELRLILRDETQQSHLERLVNVVSSITGILESCASIETVAGPILCELCSEMHWRRGELWRFEPADASWNLIGQSNAACPRGEAAGLRPRDVLHAGLPQLVRERLGMTHFEHLVAGSSKPPNRAAEHLGSHQAIGLPVMLQGDVVGVLLFYDLEMPQPDNASSKTLQAVASQIAMLLKRDQFERDLREAEQNLAQSRKMEAVGLLAGSVAHDFNNLLTIILGSSEIALEMLDQDSAAAGMVRETMKAGQRGAALTRQLLAFSRKQPLEPVVLNVNTCIQDAQKMLRRLVDERIEVDIQAEDPIQLIKFDAVQFEQVLLNLVANARDAILDAGQITIRTRNQALSGGAVRKQGGSQPGEFVVVTVSDTGCGMDEATLARVYEPFFTTKERGKGTGMGLATVYGIVKQSGGFLSIESRPGHGTAVSVFIPRTHDVPQTWQVNSPVANPSLGTESILLVEDEAVLRSLTAQMLAARGYTVLQAPDGEEALQLLTQIRGRVDLLVSDVMMPGMTGPALVSRMLSAGYLIPTLYISGYVGTESDGQKSATAGCPLLRKPFTGEGLAAAIRRVLDSQGVVNAG